MSRVVEIGLLALVVFGVVVLGGVLPWTKAVLPIGVLVLAAVWMAVGRSARVPVGFVAAAAGLVGYLGFQLVPLAPGVLATLSPTTAELHRDTVGSLGPPVFAGPSGADNGARILRLARESERVSADANRPLALHPHAAKRDLFLYLAYGLVLWMAATVHRPRFLMRGLFVAGVAVATFAIVQFVTWNGFMFWFFEPYGVGERPELSRMGGPFVNPNHLGVFLGMILPLGLGLLATPVRSRRRRRAPGERASGEGEGSRFLQATLLVLGMTVVVGALFGSASRGSVFAVLLAGTVFWWGVTRVDSNGADRSNDRTTPRRRKGSSADRLREAIHRHAPVLVAAAVIIGGLVYAGEAVRQTLDMRFAQLIEEEHWFKRATLVWQSAPVIRDFAVFGTGIGGWPDAFSLHQRYPLVGARPGHAHDDYVEWLCEVGLVGVGLTGLLAWAWISWVRRNGTVPRGIRWALVAAVAVVGVSSLYEFGLRMPGNALVLAVVLGLLVNPHWSRRASGDPTVAGPKPVWLRLGGVAAAALLVAPALGQLREAFEWKRISVDGSTDLAFASTKADTWYRLGQTLYEQGHRYDAATEAAFRKTIDVKPLAPSAWWALGATAPTRDRQLDMLANAVRLRPYRTDWRLHYAVRLDAAGRVEDGLEEIVNAIVQDPRLQAHPYVRREGADLDEPLRSAVERGLARALEVYDDDPRVWHEVASFRARFHDWAGAADLWLRSAAETSDWSGYGLRAAEAAARSGDLARAEELFWKVIEDDPRSERAYRMLAERVHQERGDWSKAEEVLELGLKRVGGREAAPLHLARFQLTKARSGGDSARADTRAALESLERAAELRNRDPGMQHRLGREYYLADDYHRAKMAFERAIRLRPDRARYHYDLGATLEKMYRPGEARAAYRKAVDLAPDDEGYRKALERIEEAFEEVG